MAEDIKGLVAFLDDVGVSGVGHTGKTYMGHLVAVYRYLQRQGCTEEVCRAGMFHSIYGTQRFQGFKLPLEHRAQVRERIGERAERLAYLNCALDRASFDRAAHGSRGPYRFRDRITGEEVELGEEDFTDLCRIHFYDWLEQVPRSREWDYRRPGYLQLAERLGPAARGEYERVYAGEGCVREGT